MIELAFLGVRFLKRKKSSGYFADCNLWNYTEASISAYSSQQQKQAYMQHFILWD